MATKRVQRLGHPTAQAQTFLGKEREITVNTTKKCLIVHDGILAGGYEQARSDLDNVSNATSNNPGKMSAAQVVELTAATTNIADHETRVTALEAFQALFPNVNGTVNAADEDLNLLTSKSGADIAVMRAYYQGVNQTIWYVYNTVPPPGCVMENPDANTRVLTIGDSGQAAAAGTDDPESKAHAVNTAVTGTCNSSGATDDFTLTTNELPNLSYSVGGSAACGTGNVSGPNVGGCGGGWNTNLHGKTIVNGGQGHPHTITNLAGTVTGSGSDTVTVAPRYARGMLVKVTG